ncbi:hypothetical protein PC129_g23004 [Phytophthora cactorum]|uniref:Uncharacterized protein n=1 Tax=Phytophthora cactorum TaxID=29920 RepID=A0A329R7C7_9STRA|nr:hypothetical protein Pcac1_g7123 [Phytophthora cactorum]KAG2803393.1 hypothetical protein PC112_g19188 [Phytophthora cactorum]KAG2804400.1 hypothetical protein PC111_g18272 [Phytophthora cactorum]KAG2841182.1 hypothetical protein PC113_g19093 [Phytophthora cactorum]KAG2882616.1 hypothetical protein PC114_g20942 [Phytophthora cactorum]
MVASPQGRYSFIALELVADRLGVPDWFSWYLVEQFYAERAACGVVWTPLQTFIRRLNAAARAVGDPEICMDTVAVNQRQAVLSDPNTVLALEYLLLAPRLYLVAGFAPYPARRSHAFVLEVTVTGRYAPDDEAARVPLVDYAYPWLGGLQFVRCLVLRR